jgi:hypothetical protein
METVSKILFVTLGVLMIWLSTLFFFETKVYAGTFELFQDKYDAYINGATGCTGTDGSNGGNFGDTVDHWLASAIVSTPVDFNLSTVEIPLYSSGVVDDELVMYVYPYVYTNGLTISTSTLIATSDSIVVDTSESLRTFTFASEELSAGEYIFGMRRTGSASSTAFYHTLSFPSCTVRSSFTDQQKSFRINGTYSGALGMHFMHIVGTTADSGGIMECDMASTTEAIYTVGYTINLFLGIFLFIACVYLGFIFVKRFIHDFRT